MDSSESPEDFNNPTQDEGCNNSLPFVNGFGNDQTEYPSPNPCMSMADIMNMDFVDPNNPLNSARKQSEHIDQPPDDVAGEENVLKLGHEYNTMAFQHHEMRRSYLKFEDAQHTLETNWHSQIHLDGEVASLISITRQQTPFNTIQSIPYLNPTPTMSIDEPSSSGLHQLKTNQHLQIDSDGEEARSLSLARKQTPFNTIQPDSYPQRYLDPAPIMSITKPSSSGLQPNNFFNSGATGNVKSAQMGSFNMQERKSKPLFNSVDESLVREITDDYKPVNGSNLKSLLLAYLVKSSNKSVVLNPIMDQSTQADKNKRNAENEWNEKDFYRSNPQKGRKHISESSRDDSCILSCQCKKIKCVKLYCKCFAAGSYCAETCSCQGCLNVKKCDDEVFEAREIIESRNPLAFAPKVVQHSIEPSASGHGEDGTRLSPSSARHIRGCNCKKSMCLKKYCDCYQSGVGCSDGCHCEGCQNVYGQKGEKGIMKGPLSGEENNQRADSSLGSFDTAAPTNDGHNTYLGTDQNLTPLLQQLLHSNQEEDESNTWSSLENYFMSPDTRLLLDDNDSVPETAKETLDPFWSNQELEVGNAETMDEFGFSAPCQKPEETWTKSSAPLFPYGSSHYYCVTSPNWRGSRISNVPDFRGTELDQMVAYGCALPNMFEDNQPDYTLEYPPISLNTVKVSSQNKKRVSPPHDPVQEFGSNSPVGLLNQFSHPRFSR